LSSAFGRLCYDDVISEYGGPPEKQSALNLVYLLGYDDSIQQGSKYQPQTSPVLAGTDEKYHVHGGNEQIIAGLVSELPAGTIQLGQQLVALKDNGNLTCTCTFQSGASTQQVIADHVVLAIPFTTLRQVDLSKSNLSALKRTAISNLPLGTNAKIQIQFNGRPWNADGFTGNMFSDDGAAGAWDPTSYQPGLTGILLDFPGGTQGAQLPGKYGVTADSAPAPAAMVSDTLAALEPIFPGVTAAYNGKAWFSCGLLDPHLLGAYSYYLTGQYTGFSGIEPVQQGNIHFAGEQTSLDFPGYMEGAVTSGERVSWEI
jgi:monoamine oxidase